MKKIIALTLSLGMTVGIASACGKKAEPAIEEETGEEVEETEEETEKETEEETEQEVRDEEVVTPETSEATANTDPSIFAAYGVLYTINVSANYQSFIEGISLSGNQTGSSELNSKELSLLDVRCSFMLNEWISFYLDDKSPDGIQVYAFKFVNDPNLYNDVTFDENIEGYVAMCNLSKPEEEGVSWGDFYINPVDADPGDYTFVFVYQGKAIHQMRVLLAAEGTLQNLTDTEVEALTR